MFKQLKCRTKRLRNVEIYVYPIIWFTVFALAYHLAPVRCWGDVGTTIYLPNPSFPNPVQPADKNKTADTPSVVAPQRADKPELPGSKTRTTAQNNASVVKTPIRKLKVTKLYFPTQSAPLIIANWQKDRATTPPDCRSDPQHQAECLAKCLSVAVITVIMEPGIGSKSHKNINSDIHSRFDACFR